MIRLLLAHGASVNADRGAQLDCEGWQPKHGPAALHIIFGSGWLQYDKLDAARVLIHAGAKVEGIAEHLPHLEPIDFNRYEDAWDTLGLTARNMVTEGGDLSSNRASLEYWRYTR